LSLVERFVLRSRISAGVLGVLRFDGEFDKASTQALDLFFGGGAQIVRRCDGSETPCCGDCLQSCNSSTDDKHTRRRYGASGGGQHREYARMAIGGDQDRFVAAYGAHRGKGIHALSTRGTRNQFDGKCSHAPIGDLLDDFARSEWAEKAD